MPSVLSTLGEEFDDLTQRHSRLILDVNLPLHSVFGHLGNMYVKRAHGMVRQAIARRCDGHATGYDELLSFVAHVFRTLIACWEDNKTGPVLARHQTLEKEFRRAMAWVGATYNLALTWDGWLEDVVGAWDDDEAFPEPWRGILERPVLIKEEKDNDKDLLWNLPPHPDKAVPNDPDMDLTPATPRATFLQPSPEPTIKTEVEESGREVEMGQAPLSPISMIDGFCDLGYLGPRESPAPWLREVSESPPHRNGKNQ